VLTQGQVGETYNIGANNEWTNLSVVERLCDLCDELAPELGGHSRTLIAFVPDRAGHDRRYAIDGSRLRHELDWHPTYSFDRGIRETVAWYLENRAWLKRVDAACRPSLYLDT
jgi:dTDP-glucose 4,6-dehydratase